MPHGYSGRILRVDLTDGRVSIETPDDVVYRRYFGGRNLIAHYLLEEVAAGVDPLSPANRLIFATGVLTGAPISGSGRNSVGAKSPLTGGYGDAEVGGHWGAELKRAGVDAIICEGRARDPVYLWVTDGTAEIRDAGHLWGRDTGAVQHLVREELGDQRVRVASIGVGGENLVRFACVINDLKDAAGRTGMGAVMGSKNLKAIAARGHEPVRVADPTTLGALNARIATELPGSAANLNALGTGANLRAAVVSGNLPTRNFRDGEFPHPDAIDANAIRDMVRVGMDACFACAVRCKKVVAITEPWRVDPAYGGPEYETIAALGSNCGVGDLKAICKGHELCQRHSLDTISTGATIAFAMECYERGLLTDADTEGLALRFGDGDAMVTMVERIATREGLGDLLAEGTQRAAAQIGGGAAQYAIHVKGEEVPMHEPRLKRALGLGYMVGPTGADHNCNVHDTSYVTEGFAFDGMKALGILNPLPVEDLGPEKVRLYLYGMNWRSVCNCLGFCNFIGFLSMLPTQLTQTVRAVTGWNTSTWELLKVGERAVTLPRIFNLREGFTAADDALPARFLQPQIPGPLPGLDEARVKAAKCTYYAMMGWDPVTGVPSRDTLAELDIAWAADHLPEPAP